MLLNPVDKLSHFNILLINWVPYIQYNKCVLYQYTIHLNQHASQSRLKLVAYWHGWTQFPNPRSCYLLSNYTLQLSLSLAHHVYAHMHIHNTDTLKTWRAAYNAVNINYNVWRIPLAALCFVRCCAHRELNTYAYSSGCWRRAKRLYFPPSASLSLALYLQLYLQFRSHEQGEFLIAHNPG